LKNFVYLHLPLQSDDDLIALQVPRRLTQMLHYEMALISTLTHIQKVSTAIHYTT